MPTHWKLSRTFNVDRLKDASNVDRTQEQEPPPPLRLKTQGGNKLETYEVEEIRSWRRNPNEDGRIEYETKWTVHTQLTWEPGENLRGGGDEVLEDFGARERVPAQVAPKPKPRRRKRRGAT